MKGEPVEASENVVQRGTMRGMTGGSSRGKSVMTFAVIPLTSSEGEMSPWRDAYKQNAKRAAYDSNYSSYISVNWSIQHDPYIERGEVSAVEDDGNCELKSHGLCLGHSIQIRHLISSQCPIGKECDYTFRGGLWGCAGWAMAHQIFTRQAWEQR